MNATMPSSASASDLKLLGSSGVSSVIRELGSQFEAASGHKVFDDYEVIAVLKRRIDAGEAFDVAILGPEAIDDLIQKGKVAADARAPFGRTGLGVAVRKGAPKPDIGTPEALKRALLDAKTVAHSKEGQSGVHFAALLDRLGIAEQMKGKLKSYDAGGLRQSLAAGEVEMAVTGYGPVLAMAGADVVGPVPQELRTYVVFHAAVATGAKDPAAARALLKFLTAPAAAPVLQAKGLEPG